MRYRKFSGLFIILIFLAGMFLLIAGQWQTISEHFDLEQNDSRASTAWMATREKQKGAHVFFAPKDSANFHFLSRNNIEWVTLVPWGFQDDYNSYILNHHNGDSLQIRKSDSNWLKRMRRVHEAGFKIFLKPHIWIEAPTDGKWRSDIYPINEVHWELWKNNYQDFIFRYARLAELAKVEMFCVGMELSRLSVEKPMFWTSLIQEVKKIYSGKITYAANWHHEYEQVIFWDQLDYIGIQAYFPLVKNEHPSVQQISTGWSQYFPALESITNKFGRQIIFTEIGYKSTADSAIQPWEWIDDPANRNKTISTETQANCYQAFFDSVWPKEWLAGVHIWQMKSDYLARQSARTKMDFTPLGKPAEQVIAKGYE